MNDLAPPLFYVVGLAIGALLMRLWIECHRPDRRTVVLRRLARLERWGRG